MSVPMKKKKNSNDCSERHVSSTDISNLSILKIKNRINVGDIYTYKELCNVLDVPFFKNKRQKEAQLKTFMRFFNYVEDDQYYVIDEIFNEIQPKIKRKTRSDSVYMKYIEYLIMNCLYSADGNQIQKTSKGWWLTLGLINANYEKLFMNSPDENKKWIKQQIGIFNDVITEEDENHNTEIIENFKERTAMKYYQIFYKALKSMEDRRFIKFEKRYMVGNNESGVHQANTDEIEIWLEAERMALKEIDYIILKDLRDRPYFDDRKYIHIERVSQICYQKRKYRKKFYELKKKYREDLAGWTIGYETINIIFTKYGLKQQIDYNTAQAVQWKKILNENVEQFFNRQLLNDKKQKLSLEDHQVLQDIMRSKSSLKTDDLLQNNIILNNDAYLDIRKELTLTNMMLVI